MIKEILDPGVPPYPVWLDFRARSPEVSRLSRYPSSASLKNTAARASSDALPRLRPVVERDERPGLQHFAQVRQVSELEVQVAEDDSSRISPGIDQYPHLRHAIVPYSVWVEIGAPVAL